MGLDLSYKRNSQTDGLDKTVLRAVNRGWRLLRIDEKGIAHFYKTEIMTGIGTVYHYGFARTCKTNGITNWRNWCTFIEDENIGSEFLAMFLTEEKVAIDWREHILNKAEKKDG